MSELSDGEVSPSQRDGDVCSEEQTMWDWVKQKAAFLLEVRLTRCSARAAFGLVQGMGFAVPKLVAQCTQSRLCLELSAGTETLHSLHNITYVSLPAECFLSERDCFGRRLATSSHGLGSFAARSILLE